MEYSVYSGTQKMLSKYVRLIRILIVRNAFVDSRNNILCFRATSNKITFANLYNTCFGGNGGHHKEFA